MSKAITALLETMRALRDPETGCPWDREQTMTSILPYTLEEIYELVDAVERGDTADIRDELGDLLFHVVYYAQIADEQGSFDFNDVAEGVDEKLKRRHPHVFGSAKTGSAQARSAAWEEIKRQERQQQGKPEAGLLDSVNRVLPALQAAYGLQKKAATVGFDWDGIVPVVGKVEEELGEIRQELDGGGDRQRLTEETGDLLFACVNLVRHAGVDPEAALRGANRKFSERFRYIESRLREEGRGPEDVGLEELEALWQEAKKRE
jgi:ATP diphosphatase